MPNRKEPRVQDLEIFIRALENVLRRLIRFLVGRISLLKLNEMVRTIYIQEAERQLKLERPTKNVSLTRLAVLTGIDTRTLTKVRNSEEYWNPVHKTKRFLKDMTPEMCVLDVWSGDAKYLDPETGHPKALKVGHGENSFEQLVNDTVSARGVTAKSLLAKLRSNGAIRLTKDSNEVELVETFFGPFKSGDAIGALDAGLSCVAHQMETVFHNYDAVSKGEKPFYDRIWFTSHLDPRMRTELRKSLTSILKRAHKKAYNILSSVEEKITSQDQILAGVGMYYFESLPDPNDY